MAVGTFEQKISLEGATEVRRQLEALGDAGKTALDSFNRSVQVTQQPLTRFRDNIRGAVPDLNRLSDAANLLSTALGPLGQGAANAASFFGSARGGLAAGVAAAAGAVVLLAKNFSDTVINTNREARALGLTVEQLQGFQKAAKDAGLDQESLNAAITRFSGRVAAEAQDQFKALVDIAKQVSTRLPGSGIKFIDPEQLRLLREAALEAGPQIRQIFAAAGDRFRAGLPVQLFTAEIERLLRTSEQFRNLVRQIAIPVPALESVERFDALLKQNEATLTNLGIKTRDANNNLRGTGDILLETLDKLQQMPDGFQRTTLAAQLFTRQVGPELATALTRGGIEAAIQKLRETGRVFDADLTQQALRARNAFNQFNAAAGKTQNTLARQVLPAVTNVLESINRELSGEQPIFSIIEGSIADNFIKGIRGAFETIKTDSAAAWAFIAQQAQPVWDQIVGFAQSAADRIRQIWQQVGDAIRNALPTSSDLEGFSDPGGGFARGGWTGGVGTRQIAGFVHGQEYVEPAHVVRQPGVRAFLELLRRNGGDLGSAIHRFARGFSDGGFVNSLNASLSRNFRVPGYAAGGLVQAATGGKSGGGLTLVLGNERFGGLSGPDDVVERLQRAAIRRQVTSGGRKSSHF